MAIKACSSCGRGYDEDKLPKEKMSKEEIEGVASIPGVAEQERRICPSCGGTFSIYLITEKGERVASESVRDAAALASSPAPKKPPR